MSKVRFSVVITSYNHSKFIRDAVDSALSQLYPAHEVIVIDDCSTDDSVSQLESYGNAIQLIQHRSNQGISRARNTGSSRAVGDYIVYLDGDDVFKPFALLVYEWVIRAYQPKVILCSLSWFHGPLPDSASEHTPNQIELVVYGNLTEKDRGFRSSASALVIERHVLADVHAWTEGFL